MRRNSRLKRAGFDALADARFVQILESGKTIPWPDVRRYIEDRVAGKLAPRPVAKKKRS
jgi:hypothetical protein